MAIQMYPDELNWVNAQLADREKDDKSFLGTFCNAALRADDLNYEIIRPALLLLEGKYPARAKRLQAEYRDDPRVEK